MSDAHEWQRILDENESGNHLAGWTSTDGFLRDLMSRFLDQGLGRNELVLVVLPRDELGDLAAFIWRGEQLELPDGGVVCAPWTPDAPAGGRG